MKKFDWKTIQITMINWTLFILLASAFGNYLLLQQNKELLNERVTCESEWNKLNTMIEEGKLVIQMEKEDLK